MVAPIIIGGVIVAVLVILFIITVSEFMLPLTVLASVLVGFQVFLKSGGIAKMLSKKKSLQVPLKLFLSVVAGFLTYLSFKALVSVSLVAGLLATALLAVIVIKFGAGAVLKVMGGVLGFG